MDRFIPTTAAAKAFNISSQQLRQLTITELTFGKHFIDCRSCGSSKPLYRYNVEELKIYFATPPEKRRRR